MNLINFKYTLFCFLLLFTASVSLADSSKSSRFSGFYKGVFKHVSPGQGISSGSSNQNSSFNLNNDIRLKFFWKPDEILSSDIAYEVSPNFIKYNNSSAFNYRLVDFNRELYPSQVDKNGYFSLMHNLDRTSVNLTTETVDFIIGRQPIAFGSARVINPTNVLSPFTYTTIDQEEITGVDAIRTRIPMGDLAETDTGFVFGKDSSLRTSAAFFKPTFNFLSTDISVLIMSFRELWMVGLDIQRSLGNAGFWLETAYTWGMPNYTRLSTGLDSQLSPDFYGFIEYHFNGAGIAQPDSVQYGLTEFIFAGPASSNSGVIDTSFLNSSAFTKGGVYLTGRHYITPGMSYDLTPLTKLTGALLTNVSDASLYFSTKIDYNFSTNTYFSTGMYLRPRGSEFGHYPNIFFTSVRCYF